MQMNYLNTARTIVAGAGLMLLFACALQQPGPAVTTAPGAGGKPAEAPKPKPTPCTDPRPQVCTMDYRPVCATRDTGIRCVTTPCPSTEKRTYSNGCGACSDPKVSGYVPEACPE
jgi:hypothetical protein